MLTTSTFVVAASSLFSLAFAAPIPTPSLVQRATYVNYGGDGTTNSGWPAKWKDFSDLWTANVPTMKISCSQFDTPNNSDDEINAIKAAIEAGSQTTNIPKEVILALIMQESKGCVRAPTTNYGHNNPGLMQSFDGTASCNQGGVVTTPCPADNIKNQIFEGLGLLGRPFGFQQAMAQADPAKYPGVANYYRAARIYNSGSIAGNNLGAGIATHCYSSDIANRLMGWTTDSSACQEASIGSYMGTSGQQANTEVNGNTNTETPQPIPTQTNTTPTNNGDSNPTAPKGPGAPANCKTWYTVQSGDTCASSGHESALRNLNQLDANCGNLWLGYAYCIAQ